MKRAFGWCLVDLGAAFMGVGHRQRSNSCLGRQEATAIAYVPPRAGAALGLTGSLELWHQS
jgi:hypothetical protein